MAMVLTETLDNDNGEVLGKGISSRVLKRVHQGPYPTVYRVG